ncbi:MAG: hypothetical protein HY660_11295 [Armatimonadetes bacterium]|nr:hypothetical protein [Armatimonadota bacterium]
MIEAILTAQTEDERTLEVIRAIFLALVLFGFAFYGAEHWIVGHYLKSWQSKVPFYVSLVGFVLTLGLFFTRAPVVRYPFLVWMAVAVLAGTLGAYYHLAWNAQSAEVGVWTVKGFAEAFKGTRPVLAALAHTHIGATGLVVAFGIRK